MKLGSPLYTVMGLYYNRFTESGTKTGETNAGKNNHSAERLLCKDYLNYLETCYRGYSYLEQVVQNMTVTADKEAGRPDLRKSQC